MSLPSLLGRNLGHGNIEIIEYTSREKNKQRQAFLIIFIGGGPKPRMLSIKQIIIYFETLPGSLNMNTMISMSYTCANNIMSCAHINLYVPGSYISMQGLTNKLKK
jgi:hypothetical protein